MNRTKQTLLALCLALPFAAQAGPAENARPQARLSQPDASEQAKANLALVLEFFEGFFNRHDVSIAERLVAEDYRQHNPFVADGREPFVRYFSGEFASNPKMRTQILRVAVNDDLCSCMCTTLHPKMTVAVPGWISSGSRTARSSSTGM